MQNAQQVNQPVPSNGQNQDGQAQQAQQTKQQPQPAQQISTGGLTPEVVQAPVGAQEQAPQAPETGYEQIQEIERKAEQIERKETKQQQPKVAQQEQAQVTEDQTREKKEVPKAAPPKYFGYKPPKAYMADPKNVKKKVGKGGKNDSMRWLMFFLDRLYKKESN